MRKRKSALLSCLDGFFNEAALLPSPKSPEFLLLNVPNGTVDGGKMKPLLVSVAAPLLG